LENISVSEPYTPAVEPKGNRRKVRETLRNLKRSLRRYWKCWA